MGLATRRKAGPPASSGDRFFFLRSNGALAARHTPLGIGSFGRPGLNVSGGEVAGVRWRT